jgi:dipeptidyl-peptidase 4
LVEDQAGDILYAEFAPTGGAIAFARGNNLYIYNDTTVTQITDNGGPDMFNGVTDWVYEEEIFGHVYAFWWSPDAQFVAFLSFNETGVETFTIPYYMDDQTVAPPYPAELELRYPKVGSTNPTVEFNILDMSTMEYSSIPVDAFEANDTIIGEVAWVTEEHSGVLYRVFNRVQDLDRHVLVDPVEKTSIVVRERDGTDGWLDNLLAIQYVGSIDDSNTTYYVDLSDEDGWQHIYLWPVDGGESTQLTEGEWEVAAILKVDTERQLIYYTSTEAHSTERHLYSVSFTGEKTALVDDTVPAYWSASFSSGASYYILSYQGPDVPYQELYSINSTTTPLEVLTSNEALYANLTEFALPNITYLELTHPDGYSLNVMQRLPVNFDPSQKYASLFIPYGGPSAQEVHKRMSAFNWRAYIAMDPELQFVTYTVDGRGTGFKGRAFRSTVTSHLGRLEPLDQIWAAEQLLEQNEFLDPDHVGIYGHSFGGYLSAKVLEADSGVFNFALIGAPVSDWRFYDSMYTERYMKLLSDNEAGYNETAVRNATGFANIPGAFGILHGTGDDNVHYQNTAALVDLLVGDGRIGPQKMKMFAFTDSDHAIVYNGAQDFEYKFLTRMLYEEKARTGEELVHQWDRRGQGAERRVVREWVA